MGSRVLPLSAVAGLALLAAWLLRAPVTDGSALAPSDDSSSRQRDVRTAAPLPELRNVPSPGDAVAAPERAAATQAPERTPAITETIVWKPSTLEVLVYSTGGEPIRDLVVDLYKDDETVSSDVTNEHGMATFDKLSLGEHTIRLALRDSNAGLGHLEKPTNVTLATGESKRHVITLPPSGDVRIGFSRALPAGVSPGRVSLWRDDHVLGSLIRDEQGFFTARHVAPGRYRCVVAGTSRVLYGRVRHLQGDESPAAKRIMIGPTETELDVRAGRTETRELSVSGSDALIRVRKNGEPVKGGLVQIELPKRPLHASATISAFTDSEGWVRVIGLPAGDYFLFRGTDKRGDSRWITLAGNTESLTLDFEE